MPTKTDAKRPTPNPTGDFIISDTRLGIGTTDNLSTLTVRARPGFNLTGTVSSTDNSATVTGTGTLFLSELSVGDVITAGGGYDATKGVVSIESDTSLTVDSPFIYGATGLTTAVVPSAVRFDDSTGQAQVSVNGAGNMGIGTTGARAQLEVLGAGAGNYYGCPVGIRVHNTQASDAWQLVLSSQGNDFQPGALIHSSADGNANANLYFSLFDGDESHAAVDHVMIDSNGLHLLTGFSVGVNTVDANYVVDPSAHHIVVDAGPTGVTITLPSAGDCGGRMLTVIKGAGTGIVTVEAGTGDTINGAASKQISNMYDGLQLMSPTLDAHTWIAHVLTAA